MGRGAKPRRDVPLHARSRPLGKRPTKREVPLDQQLELLRVCPEESEASGSTEARLAWRLRILSDWSLLSGKLTELRGVIEEEGVFQPDNRKILVFVENKQER